MTTRSPISVQALLDVPGCDRRRLRQRRRGDYGRRADARPWRRRGDRRVGGRPARRERSIAPRFVGCVAGIATLYGLIGLTRAHQFAGIIDYTRYTYVAAILLLVGLSAFVGRRDRSARRAGDGSSPSASGGGLLAVSLVFNVRLLFDGRELFLDRAAMTRALVTVGLERPLPRRRTRIGHWCSSRRRCRSSGSSPPTAHRSAIRSCRTPSSRSLPTSWRRPDVA